MILILGKNGAGKTYAANTLYSQGFYRSVNYTTRLPREGEKNGLDYFFVSKEEFLQLLDNGFFAEYKERYGNYYGTPIDNLKENAVLIAGDQKKLERHSSEIIIPIYIDVNIDRRFKRVCSRGTNNAEVFDRFHDENFSYLNSFNAIFIDNNNKTSVEQINRILLLPKNKQLNLLTSVQDFYRKKTAEFNLSGNENQMLMYLKYEEYLLRLIKVLFDITATNQEELKNTYLAQMEQFLSDNSFQFEISNGTIFTILDNQEYEVKPKFTKVLRKEK